MPGQGMVLLVMKPFRPGAAGTFQTMAGMYRENYLDFAPLPRVHRGSPATIAWHTLCRSPILPCQRQGLRRHHPLMRCIRSVGHGPAGSMQIDELLRGRS
jgi:hypothetical protein